MHEALARSRLEAYEADSRHKSRPLHSQPALSAMGPDFKGWLGDYGPAHTKSVIPAEWNDLDDEDTLWLRSTREMKGNVGVV
ncbi:unnamed protein product [Aphanomyces euteiches]